MKLDRNYHYDEQQGIFVFDDELSINWLLSQVLNKSNLQITKISNEELNLFLTLLNDSDLRMPNGQHSLFWLREQLKEKMQLADSKTGESWHHTTIRFRFIIEQVDHILASSKDLKEKQEIKKEEQLKQIKRDPNNMEAHFEPI
jgi:hypothetical protein